MDAARIMGRFEHMTRYEGLNALNGAWVAVHVKSNAEQHVAGQLSAFGYESYLPLNGSRRRRGPPVRKDRPLFPNYVFCRFQVSPKVRIVEASGVVRLVGMRGIPLPIPDNEIDDIRRVLASDLYSEPWKRLEPGQRVRIESGPLRGIEGTLVLLRSGLRLLIRVELLQRSLAVEISGQDVAPVRDLCAPSYFPAQNSAVFAPNGGRCP